ncbi:hypothetical protein pah_c268o003 [Parachlamydia acanthamoebae str. Hall's coccus]|nr:hypothetical protein pah_c268o003 [Parachlamydia acanthamoebae str. Hall's coccus]
MQDYWGYVGCEAPNNGNMTKLFCQKAWKPSWVDEKKVSEKLKRN